MSVNGFFIISGFLIASRWDRCCGLLDFLRKRVVRIYPGFVVAVVIGSYVVAPMSAVDGSSTQTPGLISFTLKVLRLQQPLILGTFGNNRMDAVNGSLWSIPFEFWCYLGVAAMGCVPLFKHRSVVFVMFLLSLVPAYILPAFELQWIGGMWLGKIFGYPFFWARLLPLFLAGVVAWRFREFFRLSWGGVILAVIVLLCASRIPHSWAVLFPVCGTYLMLWLAFTPWVRLHNFGQYGDFSYGIYLYAFPIQQLLVMQNGGTMNAWGLFGIAFPFSVVAGVLSWFLVERPFLRKVRTR